jgi:hypothetical protein
VTHTDPCTGTCVANGAIVPLTRGRLVGSGIGAGPRTAVREDVEVAVDPGVPAADETRRDGPCGVGCGAGLELREWDDDVDEVLVIDQPSGAARR